MKQQKRNYSFRMEKEKGDKVQELAAINRRTLSAEIALLIDLGLEWRKEHGNKIPASE